MYQLTDDSFFLENLSILLGEGVLDGACGDAVELGDLS